MRGETQTYLYLNGASKYNSLETYVLQKKGGFLNSVGLGRDPNLSVGPQPCPINHTAAAWVRLEHLCVPLEGVHSVQRRALGGLGRADKWS